MNSTNPDHSAHMNIAQTSEADDARAQDAGFGLIAEALAPVAPPDAQAGTLRNRLLARVANSAEQHRGLRTFRREDAQWQQLTRGVRACVLHDNGITRSAIVEFAPGSSLPSHRHAAHEECIVLSGSLQAGDCHVGQHDFHLAPAGSRHETIRSAEGAIAFLRGTSIGSGQHMLREMLTAWLPFGRKSDQPFTIAQDEGWRTIAEGAWIKPLWQQEASASMLMKLDAGARLPAHPHAVDEECLLIQGEAFIGDILLRTGEYQFGPVGTRHGELTTDAGALLFVHGDAAYAALGK